MSREWNVQKSIKAYCSWMVPVGIPYTGKIFERVQRLIEITERNSNRCDFEIVRKMHGLPPKKSALKKPK